MPIEPHAMKILALFGRESDYPRNALLMEFLSFHYDVDNPQAWIPTRSIILRSLQVILRALPAILFRKYRAVLIGFYGYPILILLRIFIRCPIVFDAFVSNYDTLINDRRVFKPGSLAARAIKWLDKTACLAADLVLVDTQAQKDYFVSSFDLDPAKVAVLYVGCSEDLFAPNLAAHEDGNLILHYGTATPQHGIDTIVKAAGMLSNRLDIQFLLVGPSSQLSSAVHRNGQEDNTRLQLKPPIPIQDLPELIRSASVCLCGHFGESEKAGRVIAAKTYQCIALGKAVIVGNNPANRELLTPGVDACFCPPADPAALAQKIVYLIDHPEIRASLGENGAATYKEKASNSVLRRSLYSLIQSLPER